MKRVSALLLCVILLTAAVGAQDITDPDVALRLLLDGNERYVQAREAARRGEERRHEVAGHQFPYAVIIGCADSRVAPEVLFDAGIGDLFVVRIAGNVVDPSDPMVMGSVEYGVAELKAPLVLVLGHSGCGAVKAAKKTIDADGELPGSIERLVDIIRPAVRKARSQPGDPLQRAIDMNVALGVERLDDASPILAPAVHAGRVRVAGAVYDLASGRVRMLTKTP